MATALYSIDAENVDPVFFAVVPDSFMKREGDASRSYPVPANDAWVDITAITVLSPKDPWSF